MGRVFREIHHYHGASEDWETQKEIFRSLGVMRLATKEANGKKPLGAAESKIFISKTRGWLEVVYAGSPEAKSVLGKTPSRNTVNEKT